MHAIPVSNIFDPTFAYVYIWVSKTKRCVYVGQTCGDGGVIGRAGAHVKSSGTLRERYYDYYAEPLEIADDWILYSFRLPKKKNYTSAESGFRRAVEYLVQVGLHEVRGDLDVPFRIISNIDYSDYCRLEETKIIAKNFVKEFLAAYKI